MLPDPPDTTPDTPRPGPFYAVRCVRAYSRATGRTRAVLTALATYADTRGYCRPTIPTLARDAGVGRSTVKRALHDLVDDLGEVVVVSQGVGRGRATVYRITLVRPLSPPVEIDPAPCGEPDLKRVQGEPVSERIGSRVNDKRVHGGPPKTIELPRGEGGTFPDHCPVHRGTPDPPPCRACQRTREANAAAVIAARRDDLAARRRKRVEADRDAIHAPARDATPPPPGWRTR